MANLLLIVTNSMDGTSDVLVRIANARGLPIFRLNTDLLTDYRIRVTPDDFWLTDPIGRTASLSQLAACYVRKPWHSGAEPWATFPRDEQLWVRGQLHRLEREIVNLCRLHGKLRLVEPGADRRLDKLTQMQIAKRYFDVPTWEYVLNVPAQAGERVTKPLDPEQIQSEWRRFVFTEVVDAERLALGYPWLVQDMVRGGRDATVVYIAGKCFGFRITHDRSGGPTDWRERINTAQQDTWECYTLSDGLVAKCRAFMRDANLHYGRFDFIVDEADHHAFLELNSNGQYGWLDDETTSWLHNEVLDAVMSPANAIPIS